jgi:hypothetical protein
LSSVSFDEWVQPGFELGGGRGGGVTSEVSGASFYSLHHFDSPIRVMSLTLSISYSSGDGFQNNPQQQAGNMYNPAQNQVPGKLFIYIFFANRKFFFLTNWVAEFEYQADKM